MPRKLTEEQIRRIREVAALRRAIPTNAQLAKEMGCCKALIDQATANSNKVGVSSNVSRGTLVDMSAPCSRCGGLRNRTGQKYCRACHAAYQRENRLKYSELNPEQRMKSNSRAQANNAQRRGQIIKQPCEKCGEPESQKHHDDYSKPLAVRWLCAGCHQAEHETLTRLHNSHVELDPAKP